MLPTIKIGNHDVTRLICGGNPFSAISHLNAELDREMLEYYIMPNLQRALRECWEAGMNTIQSRGDRHQMRMILEHRLTGGEMQWIAQTASEFRDIHHNIREIARFEPIGIHHHGTHTDNSWHTGRIDEVRDYVKAIKDLGLLAGIGTHIPEVVEYAEDKGWETDFYMACVYNLARGYKSAPAAEQNAYANDRFPASDPPRMYETIRQVPKPCLAFKVLAATRRCGSEEELRRAFEEAYAGIKHTDAVVVGLFQKHKDQAAEDAGIVRAVPSL